MSHMEREREQRPASFEEMEELLEITPCIYKGCFEDKMGGNDHNVSTF